MAERYEQIMAKLLPFKKTVTLCAIALFAFSLFMATNIRSELMAATDERQIGVTLKFKPGLSLDGMDEITKHVEEYVAADQEIEKYSTMVSKEEANATINAYLKKKSKYSTAELIDKWNKDLSHYDDRCDIKAALADPEGMGDTGGGNSTEVVLVSSDLDALKQGLSMVEEVVSQTNGVLNLQNTVAGGGFKAEVAIDPDLAQAYGFAPNDLANKINQQISAQKAFVLADGDMKYDVKVELPKELRDDVNALSNLMLTNNDGRMVALSDVANIVYKDSPQTIERTDGQFQGSIKATLAADSTYEAQEAIQKSVESLELPNGVSIGKTSAAESMDEEFSGIGKAIFAAVFLVFMVMAIQFESIKYSLLVMFCIPFSIIGSVFLLLISQSKLSMTSLMGFLMLAGIVVNNGILFIDTTNSNRKQMHAEDALILAGKSRLRPILMTTMTTILSMLPMCIERGGNGDSMKGMAMVIIGGLISSTILTFILLPTVYMIIHKTTKVSGE